MNDYRDRLLHVLLEGELGQDAPPDLAAKVLARAFGWRRRVWAVAAAAAAAAVLVGGWAFWDARYPSPAATGLFTVQAGGSPRRGATLATTDGQATLVLGGYCRLGLDRNTNVTIEGQPHEEALFLHRGGLTCTVRPQRGAFRVRTELGEVRVTGTDFVVRLDQAQVGQPALGKRLWVRVLAGAVSVQAGKAERVLTAGQETSVFSSGPTTAARPGRIEAGAPAYAAKPKEAWKDRGRIVGAARGGPPFTLAILDAAGKEVKAAQSFRRKDGRLGFEVEWLQPGFYGLRIQADAYTPLYLHPVEIKANQDLQLDLEFTP
jgi:ferric-dicitrate binding protein FerR (iron transport regulator)